MSAPQLRERMKGWLAGGYKAVLLSSSATQLAYALYREGEESVYLRQLFVDRGHRRQGIGKEVVAILREQLWPIHKRLIVEVPTANEPAVTFWRSVGFIDYAVILEIL